MSFPTKEEIQARTASGNIKELRPGEVFTFGSNTGGRHSKGAALTAKRWGAKNGQGDGLMGQTYGIPTKDERLKILSPRRIGDYVDDFITCAKQNPDLTFLVTEIGCGLARYEPSDMAPLFADAAGVPNIHLPARFWKVLQVAAAKPATEKRGHYGC